MRMAWYFVSVAMVVAGCGSNLSEGLAPKFAIFLADKPVTLTTADAETAHEFSAVTPGLGQSQLVKVRIRNLGGDPFDVTKVSLLETNKDGTARSPWVTLEWGSIDPVAAIPFTATNVSFGLEFQVRYEPGAECVVAQNCESSATLLVEHTDPKTPPARLVFGPPKCRREPKVDPPKDTFFNASAARPETKTFKISNTGTCSCAVNDVTFTKATDLFTITRAFANGTEIEEGESLDFTVTYTPAVVTGEDADPAGDKATLAVDVDCRLEPIFVPLDTKSETGEYEVTYDDKETKGYLDFTAVTGGCEERTISIYNVGPSTMTVQGWSIPEDAAGEYYTMACEFPPAQEGASATPVPNPPAGLAVGRTLECKVKYCATTLTGKNATIAFSYRNPTEGTFEVQAFGGEPKSCFEYAPGSAGSPSIVDFIADKKGDTIEQRVIVYNCGNDDLIVNKVRLEEPFGIPGTPSKYFVVKDAPTFPVTVGVAALQPITVAMTVSNNETEVSATMYIDYVDPFGSEVTGFGVDLRGVVGPTATVPVAVAEAIGDMKVGSEIVLSGAGSTPVAEISNEGYLWYLISKPAGSGLIVHGATTISTEAFTPDKAGQYVFGLRVFANADPFLYSDEATVTVDITDP